MNIDELKQHKVAKYKCLTSLLFFTRYFFKKRHNRKFVIGDHHTLICEALEKVLRGETRRLIINIAPRYGKTEIAVKNFIAHGLAVNPSAKFIHLTYADSLALDNSEEAKDLVASPEYQQLFPNVQIKKDSKSKEKWYTTENGGVYATSAGGQVTGFGAGKVDDEEAEIAEWMLGIGDKAGFGGAIIIDDPIKPDDATSGVKRERINNRFETTIRNRVNSRNTPIIVIGQRVHEHDLSGYLMEIEPEEWTVLSLPALKEDNTPLWPFKHTLLELEALKKVSDHVFETQYQQNPKPLSGLIYGNWKRIPDANMPFDDERFVGGLDFGYTNDPTAGVKVWIIGENVYVHELCYTPDIPPVTMGQIFKANGFDKEVVYCEHDPDQIAQLRRFGWRCAPARKGPGSINSGIMKLKEFNVFYSESSEHLHKEVMSYAWDIDKSTGKPSNTPIDAWNHLLDAIRYAVYSHVFTK